MTKTTTSNVQNGATDVPRRVAILESSARMGGIQHTTLALATRLHRSNWTPVLICPEDGELTDACRAAGIEVHIQPVLPMWSTSIWLGNETKIPNPFAWLWNVCTIFSTAKRTSVFLKELSPDLVLTKGLLCHFYGGLAARRAGIPSLWYVQDFISERFAGIYKKVFGFAARNVPSSIAVIGPQIVRQLPEDLRERTTVVYNAIDPGKFRNRGNGEPVRRELGIPSAAIVIGTAARLTPWKGQHHLLEAFAKIAVKSPEARLLLVGGSLFGDQEYEKNLRHRTQELGLEQRVIFAGHRQDINDVLAAIDVFAYCSTEKDICPLSLLEAMSAGLPIAAFEIEGVREAMDDDREGLLVPVANSDHLAKSLSKLMHSPDLCRRLGASARARVERQFSLETHVLEMEGVFETVLLQPTVSV
jgi:glycosyltransferase involved in cell wall biosynthesis